MVWIYNAWATSLTSPGMVSSDCHRFVKMSNALQPHVGSGAGLYTTPAPHVARPRRGQGVLPPSQGLPLLPAQLRPQQTSPHDSSGVVTPLVSRAARHSLTAAATVSALSVTAAAARELSAGLLVEYEVRSGRSALALLQRNDGKKNWWAVDEAGKAHSITPKQILLVIPGSGYNTTDLARFQALATAAAAPDTSMLELAWEIAAEDGPTPQSLDALSELLYNDSKPASLYTTFKLLQADGIYFKQSTKGGVLHYEPRPATVVQGLLAQAAKEAAARQDAESFVAAIKGAISVKSRAEQPTADSWAHGPHAKRVAALRAFALGRLVSPGGAAGGSPASTAAAALVAESVQLLGVKAYAAAVSSVLVDAGIFRLHEPLEVLTQGLDLQWPPHFNSLAERLCTAPPPDPDAAIRLDLRHLPAITIDDASTTEVDDGLSVEPLPDGSTRVWVHVADPTRWLTFNHVLDVEARSRTRTLYFPFGIRSMFPEVLALGPFSLTAGQDSCAFSIGVVLQKDGSLSADLRISPTTIHVTQRLTYDEADAMLAQPQCPLPHLAQLAGIAQIRQAYRAAQGCIDIPLPEPKIVVPADDLDVARPRVQISIQSQYTSASRQLVAELMILAGEAAGRAGVQAGLPLPYRSQDTPQLPPQATLDAMTVPECRAFELRRCMTRSGVASVPSRHSSLGLDHYVQVTSPIRRYGDLLAHFQLKAWCRGEPAPFKATDIDGISSLVGEKGRELNVVERGVEQYWTAEYFRQRSGQQWQALLLGWLRPEQRLAIILLTELGIETVTRVNEERAQPGDLLELQLTAAEPRSGTFRFAVVGVSSSAITSEAHSGSDSSESSYTQTGTDSSNSSNNSNGAMPGDGSESGSSPIADAVVGNEHLDGTHGHDATSEAELREWEALIFGDGATSSQTSSTVQ